MSTGNKDLLGGLVLKKGKGGWGGGKTVRYVEKPVRNFDDGEQFARLRTGRKMRIGKMPLTIPHAGGLPAMGERFRDQRIREN